MEIHAGFRCTKERFTFSIPLEIRVYGRERSRKKTSNCRAGPSISVCVEIVIYRSARDKTVIFFHTFDGRQPTRPNGRFRVPLFWFGRGEQTDEFSNGNSRTELPRLSPRGLTPLFAGHATYCVQTVTTLYECARIRRVTLLDGHDDYVLSIHLRTIIDNVADGRKNKLEFR